MKASPWTTTLILLVLAATSTARESELDRLLPGLRHENPTVRREAEREFLKRGLADPDAAIQILERAGVRPRHLVHSAAFDRFAESHRRLMPALLLGRDLAENEGAARWLLVERVFTTLPEHLRDAVLGSGEDAERVLDTRRHAREVVHRFVREWNENYMLGSDEEKRYAVLRAELEEAGPAGVAPLLEVLAIPSASTFGNLDEKLGVTARMQVRAIFGLSFLGDPVAIPALYLHTKSISFTASANAAAALQKLLGKTPDAPFTPPDREQFDAWWKEHRTDQPAGTDFLIHRLLDDLDIHLAREFLGLAETTDEAAILPYLELLSGRDLEYDEKAPIEDRLQRAAKIRAELASTR